MEADLQVGIGNVYPVELIVWLDSSVSEEWADLSSPMEVETLSTVGFVIIESKDSVELVSTFDKRRWGRHRTSIIKANIISRTCMRKSRGKLSVSQD